MNMQSGLLDKSRIVSNLLMLILVAGNIFFSIQYTEGIKQQADLAAATIDTSASRIQAARFMKEFVDIVLNTTGAISLDDRVKLENDLRQIGDSNITKQWNDFVNSKDAKTAQAGAVKLMSMVTNKML